MGFLYFIFILLFILIFIIIKSTVLNVAFLFLTKNKIEIKILVFPIILSLILFISLIFSATLILFRYNISIYSTLICIILGINYSLRTLGYILLTYGLAIILFLLAEGYILKLISIPYSKYNLKIKSIFSKNEKENMSENITTKDIPSVVKEKDSLNYGQGLIISLFSFSMIFFFIVLLIYIGKTAGTFLINK